MPQAKETKAVVSWNMNKFTTILIALLILISSFFPVLNPLPIFEKIDLATIKPEFQSYIVHNLSLIKMLGSDLSTTIKQVNLTFMNPVLNLTMLTLMLSVGLLFAGLIMLVFPGAHKRGFKFIFSASIIMLINFLYHSTLGLISIKSCVGLGLTGYFPWMTLLYLIFAVVLLIFFIFINGIQAEQKL